MKRVKGCLNSNCTEYKKTYFKGSDEYCSKCGAKLSYVCKHPKCFKQLPDNSKENICEFHIAEKKDNKDKARKVLKEVGIGVLAVGGTILTVGKEVLDIVDKKK